MDVEKIVITDWMRGQLSSREVEGEKVIKSLPCLSVVQAVEGSYAVRIEHGENYNTGTGGIFIAPSGKMQNIVHHVDPSSGNMRARWVFLYTAVEEIYPLDSFFSFPTLMPPEFLQEANRCLDAVFSAASYCRGMIACYRLIELLLKFTCKKPVGFNPIASLLDYLRKHCSEQISVADMAERMHMSQSNLYPLFKKHTGFTPIGYLNDYRLAAASALLLSSDKTLDQIAEETGFYDVSYFSRLFLKKYKMPPGRYRRQMRKNTD